MRFTILHLVLFAHLAQVPQRMLLLLTRSSRLQEQESLSVHRSTVKFGSSSTTCIGITVLMLVWTNLLLWMSSLIYSWVLTHRHTELPWRSCHTDGVLGLTTESPPTLMITAQWGSWPTNNAFKTISSVSLGALLLISNEMCHFVSLGQGYVFPISVYTIILEETEKLKFLIPYKQV